MSFMWLPIAVIYVPILIVYFLNTDSAIVVILGFLSFFLKIILER